ncbi:MAG: endonuclease [Halobacteriovoraceae bacterium]|nr:endonuclease [Halobacteriovoraceae bacterium]
MKFLLFLALTLSFNLFAVGSKRNSAEPLSDNPYYGGLIPLKGSTVTDLKATLYNILKAGHLQETGKDDLIVAKCSGEPNCVKHTKLGYKNARIKLFGDIHLETNKDGKYFIKDIYCLKEYTEADFPANQTIGKDKIPLHTIMNTEHVWPKYRFVRNEYGVPKSERSSDPLYGFKESDLHILYPSENNLNATRGHNEFGEVSQVDQDFSCSDAKSGTITLSDGSQSERPYFEPPNESKGYSTSHFLFFNPLRCSYPPRRRSLFAQMAYARPGGRHGNSPQRKNI